MTEAAASLSHPAYGRLRPVTDTASVLLADNPGLMTLEGTHTWVLGGQGSDEVVIVDPVPTTMSTSPASLASAASRWS